MDNPPFLRRMEEQDEELMFHTDHKNEHAGVLSSMGLINANYGSLLIVSDPGCGKSQMLHAILEACAQRNHPDQVAFYLVVHQPTQFADIGHLDQCRLVMQTYDKSLKDIILELVDLVEERRQHDTNGPAVLLAIDDLASALLHLDEHSITVFYWLIRQGPRSRVFTLATLSTRRLADLDLHFLEAFASRLVGTVTKPEHVKAIINGLVPQTWYVEGSHHFRLFCQSHRLDSIFGEPLIAWRRI